MLLYVFLAWLVHEHIQPEKIYTFKVNKPSFMVSKTIGDEEIPKTISTIRAKLVLGEEVNHSAKQVESNLVYATIMVEGITVEKGYGEINWGVNEQREQLHLENGANYIKHTYLLPGQKEVKCKIEVNGNTKELIYNIEIIGGKER